MHYSHISLRSNTCREKKLTAADGLSRRPYEVPIELEIDEELKEDSFIAQIEPDIFEPTNKIKPRPDRHRRQWHILTIDADEQQTNNAIHNAEMTDTNATTTEQVIDFWPDDGHELAKLQQDSKDLQSILHWLKDGQLPDDDKAARRVLLEAENYQIVDGVLYHLFFPGPNV